MLRVRVALVSIALAFLATPALAQKAGGILRVYPYVRGIALATNSQYNHWRFENVWLDR